MCKKKVVSPSVRRPPIKRHRKSKQQPNKVSVPYKIFDAYQTDFLIYEDLPEVRDKEVAKLITEIVAVEGPVHKEVVLRRLRGLWSYSRAGRRIRDKVDSATRVAVRKRWIQQCNLDSDFFIKPEAVVQVRDRGELDDPLLRKPEMIYSLEYREAILAAVQRNITIEKEECAVDVARIFGFKSTGSNLKNEIIKQIDSLVYDGVLLCQPDGIVCIR